MAGPTDHDTRLAAAAAEMAAKGMAGGMAQAPTLRLYRRLGIAARPLPYATFWAVALRMAVPFAVLYALFLVLLTGGPARGPQALAVQVIAAAVVYGLLAALWLRWRARKAGLSRWEDL